MSYITWFEGHAKKHQKIIKKLLLANYSKEEIIDYFDYKNMLIHESDFCPLYEKQKKCHDMKSLNCYLCACPNFRFKDEGFGEYNKLPILSICDINNGEKFAGKKAIHQNCSSCSVPHHKSYIEKNFDLNWKNIMSRCTL